MDVRPLIPPRKFTVGNVTIAHSADVTLEPDEQITFESSTGTELDIVRKAWGYYATSSNRRLRDHGLRMVLCANDDGRLALLLVEAGSDAAFAAYVDEQPMRVVAWLDTDEAADEAVRRLEAS